MFSQANSVALGVVGVSLLIGRFVRRRLKYLNSSLINCHEFFILQTFIVLRG